MKIIGIILKYMPIHLAAIAGAVFPLTYVWNSVSNSFNAASGRDLQRELEEKRLKMQSEIAILNTATNLEIAAKQRELQGNIATLNALQHHASLELQREQGGLNRDLQKYLAETNMAFQGRENQLNRDLQDRLAFLNREFQANEGKLNREHTAQLELFRADLQKYCLQQQRELQLQLKQLDALLAREIAVYNRETSINSIREQRRQDNSPILGVAEDLIEHANFQLPMQPLRVFLSPPILTYDPAQNNKGFPLTEETLESYLRSFLEKYSQSGRLIDLQGGAWKSNLFRAEMAANTLFMRLKSIPILILDSTAPDQNFQLRFGFSSGNGNQPRYQSAISELPWREILYNFAKIRAVQWQEKRQKYIDSGKNVADFDKRYGEAGVASFQKNLQILEMEQEAIADGDDISILNRPYSLCDQDYQDFGKFIGLCHKLIAGLMADEYFLIHVPVECRQMPLLPSLLPNMWELVPENEQPALIEMVVSFYNNLYQFLEVTEPAWIADLRLDLANSLLVFADKKWAFSQILLSIKSWLGLRGIKAEQAEPKQLFDLLFANLTVDDQAYIAKLNDCLQRAGANRQFNIVDACWQRGIKSLSEGAYSLAISDFSQVLQLDGERVLANYQRGVAYGKIKENQGAIADFDQVLRLEPNNSQAYYQRGLVYHQLGKYQEAINDYNQALSIDPNISDARYQKDVAQGILDQILRDQAEKERQRQEEEARKRREQEELERRHREELANKGKEFTFEVVKVNSQGKEILRKQGKGYQKDVNLGNGVILEMVYIPDGEFMMGAKQGEEGASDDEYPQHKVTIAKPFYMSKYPITQAQYKAIMNGENESRFKGEKRPVENVSWDKAKEFCQKSSKQMGDKTGKKYSLPSEAQWEYAARAGTDTPFHFCETLTDKLANYDARNTYASGPKGQWRQETTEVGSFPPNGFGLYDIHGNVWEWVEDHWHDNYTGAPDDGSPWLSKDENYSRRGLRGGSWGNDPCSCRVANRYDNSRTDIGSLVGFRVSCAVV
jgi:formylglycine-generating enzyme required for sulfatase activity/Tfp pilus assembly protein PilF